jgi:hypothetical protein
LEYGLCQIFINLLGASSVLRSLIQQSFGMVHMVNVYPCLQFFSVKSCEILWDFQALATLHKRRHLECCFESPRFSQEPRVNRSTPVQPNVPAMMTAPKQNTAEPSCTAEPETSQYDALRMGDMLCTKGSTSLTQAGSTTANPDVT